ncbi:MAG: 16S rRNA (uracil(1498)-N(3))-methyltransferase [Bacteroidales bacterium]|nr:16S rRNA (uracil(1498)-N(3))-methyltransferase [Bacteroidales bacterium]
MELFFSDDIQDAQVRLDPEESAHCVRVLRHREGDEISVIDGRGTLYRCVLEIADAKGAWARVLERKHGFGAHPYHLTMAVCPTKNLDRYEWFVEKVTEIGVDMIAPVIGERSERKVLKTDRLRRLALSAAKQSLKAAIPQIAEPVSVRDFIAAAPADALKLICYCFDDVPRIPITKVLQSAEALNPAGSAAGKPVATRGFVNGRGPSVSLGGMSEAKVCGSSCLPEARPIAILIGPEGDFSPEEAALARENCWIPVSLGESRLRTETAAVVAATAVYFCVISN